MRRCFACLLSGVLVLSLLLSGCELGLPQENQQASAVSVSLEEVPAYSGSPYVELDGNQPGFSLEERTTDLSRRTVPWMRWGAAARPMPVLGKI